MAEVKHWADVFAEMEKRKELVLRTISEAGALTPELEKKVEECVSSPRLEDLYLPFRPKRKTRATIAIAAGYEPLADKIMSGKYRGGAEDDQALQGARDIIAERISETASFRETLRGIYRNRRVESAVTKKGLTDPEAAKYRSYFK